MFQNLTTKNQIKHYVISRLTKLEKNTPEITVGQFKTDIFTTFISSNVHYKSFSFIDHDAPDLIYDDISPYITLITSIQKNTSSNLLEIIYQVVTDYISVTNHSKELIHTCLLKRNALYKTHKECVSITEFTKERIGFCSELAGLVHNMLIFLGYSSSVVMGTKNNDSHAFNIIYDSSFNEPIILFDTSETVPIIHYFTIEEKNVFFTKQKITCNNKEYKLGLETYETQSILLNQLKNYLHKKDETY